MHRLFTLIRSAGAARRHRRAALMAVTLAALGVGPARAEYLLASGDTLELSVTGVSDLHQKSTIDVDGKIRFPLIESIKAAGLTLDGLLDEVRRQLPQKAYRQRTAEGRENLIVVDQNEISLEIAAYQPVYVRGDVARPGEQTFRPGLTVRQVVALAGGYDVVRFRMENPILQSADLRAEYDAAWTEFARQQAHAALVRAALDGSGPVDLTKVVKAPIPQDVLADIVRVETQQMASRDADYARERTYLEHSIDLLQSQVGTLDKQRESAQNSDKQEADYMERLQPLLSKGVIAQTRMLDERRTQSNTSQRLFEATVQTADKQRARNELSRQLQRTEDDHRLGLLKELQDANVQTETIRARLQALGEKLLYTGAIKSQIVGGSASKPDIQVFHSAAAEPRHVQADEDTVLVAGDVVEISLKAELTPEGLVGKADPNEGPS